MEFELLAHFLKRAKESNKDYQEFLEPQTSGRDMRALFIDPLNAHLSLIEP